MTVAAKTVRASSIIIIGLALYFAMAPLAPFDAHACAAPQPPAQSLSR